jgi:hypothetical protein
MSCNKTRLMGRAIVPMLFFSMLFSVFASDADRVKQLIDIINKGPSLYRTQEAVAAYGRFNPQDATFAVSDNASFTAIKQSLRAAINLSDMGSMAKEAIPSLLEKFPRAEHVVIVNGAQYGPGVGQFEDWVQTYVLSAKNKFVLSSPFIEYQTLAKCEQFVEASAFTDVRNKRMSGQRIVEAQVDIYVMLRINAAACALSSITGASPEATPEAWRSWYAGTQGYQATAPVEQPIAPPEKVSSISTPANPPSDYFVGSRYSLRLSTGDYVVATIEAVDDASISIRLDSGGRYIYEKSFIREKTLLSATIGAQPAPYQSQPVQRAEAPGSISYKELLALTYSGRMLEVTLLNGSMLRGTLGVVDASMLHLNVDGADMPVSRNLISRISLVTDPADTRKTDKPAGSTKSSSSW